MLVNEEVLKDLVTGGAGFIGSHLVPKLVGTGWYVVVLDRSTIGPDTAILNHGWKSCQDERIGLQASLGR